MEILISAIIDFIDKHYHQKKIKKVLKNLKIKTVIDIGAHKGEFLNCILSINKKLIIYAFEPQSLIFRKLKKNFKSSNNIFIFNKALSNSNEKKKLNINIKTSTSTFSTYNRDSYWKKIKDFILTGFKQSSFISSEIVKTITLDNFINSKKIKNIDLLKIDTEGHELEVLNGAKKTLNNKIEYILIEFHFSKIYEKYNRSKIEKVLKKNKFVLVKKFKFPFLTFEDRLYKKI